MSWMFHAFALAIFSLLEKAFVGDGRVLAECSWYVLGHVKRGFCVSIVFSFGLFRELSLLCFWGHKPCVSGRGFAPGVALLLLKNVSMVVVSW